MSRLSAPRAALIAGLMAGAIALPAVRNGFVEDDHWVVEQRPLLQHPPSLAAILTEPFWPESFGGGLWRPTTLLSYTLDYRISRSPHWFHAGNVVWVAVATAFLTLLAAELLGAPGGLIAGLLFAAHPVHVEAYATVIGRAELLAAAGYAAALWCALRAATRDPRWLAGVALAALIAIGAKEHAATLPASVLLLAAGQAAAAGTDVRLRLRAAWPAAVTSAVPILLYFGLRHVVVGRTFDAAGLAPGMRGLGLVTRCWVTLGISAEWWRLFLVPAHLSADYSPAQVVVATGLTVRHVVAAAIWTGAGWSAWQLRRRAPAIAVGVIWLVVTLAPVSNTLFPTQILLAERTLYLPSWGIALALAGAIGLIPRPDTWKAALVAGLVVLGAARSLTRIPVWHDEDRWFAALQRDAPNSYRTLWLTGQDAFANRRWGTGERFLRAAIAAAPDVPGPREDLAYFYVSQGLGRAAVALLRESLAIDSTRWRPWSLLPKALLLAGDTVAARETAREIQRRFPTGH